MIKVLRIAAHLYPTVYGGAPIHAHEMSKLQSEMNCEVTVLTCDYDNSSSNDKMH
ncbi:hypothetical protein KAW18_07725 [candidate division WOR-3 bacterium]|nr:hypothetical protein [candidate division WOR-3 bacterium]